MMIDIVFLGNHVPFLQTTRFQVNMGSNKHKTRAEILAEERDYKRRRMSYRGKKVKRTPIQVLRDIIDGHMDEIKFTGGIGCVEMPETQLNPLDSSNSLFDRSDKHFFSEDKNQQERRNVSWRKESFDDARHGESHNNLTKHVVHSYSGPCSNKASIITDDGRRRLNEIEQLQDYVVSHHEARYSSSNNDHTSKQTRSSDIEHKREHHHKVRYSTSNDKHKSRHRRESHSQEKHHSHISSGRRHAEHRSKEYNPESSNDRCSPGE